MAEALLDNFKDLVSVLRVTLPHLACAGANFDLSQHEAAEIVAHCYGGRADFDPGHRLRGHTENSAATCNPTRVHPLCLRVKWKGNDADHSTWEQADMMVSWPWAYRKAHGDLINAYVLAPRRHG